MVSTIKWGILGTSIVARRFVASLKLCRGASAVAVVSKDPGNARDFARDFGIGSVHATVEELAGDPGVDVIYVATPTSLHAEHSLACLEAGKAVLCEKPLASSAEEAGELVEAARRAGTFLMEGMMMRFLPLMAELRSQVRSGGIGELRMLQADLSFPGGADAPLDLGVYPVSLAFDLLGAPESVQERVLTNSSGEALQVVLTLGYADAQAVLTAGSHGRGRNDATLVGTLGRIHVADPLFGSESMTLTTWKSEGEGTTQRSSGRIMERVPQAARLYRRLLPLARRALGYDRRIRRSYASFGYQFEAAEVAQCLRDGRTESSVMPLDESVAVLGILDSLSAQRIPAFGG